MTALCSVCGTHLMYDDGTGTHMLCDVQTRLDFDAATKRRKDRERDKRQQAVAVKRANQRHHELGVRIIHDAAKRKPFVSADDVRPDFLAAGIPETANGGIWRAAEARGFVTKAEERPSGGASAHKKKIWHYRSLVGANGPVV